MTQVAARYFEVEVSRGLKQPRMRLVVGVIIDSMRRARVTTIRTCPMIPRLTSTRRRMSRRRAMWGRLRPVVGQLIRVDNATTGARPTERFPDG